MKKIIAKYILLIIITCAISIFIYEYIMENKPVTTETDILYSQTLKENEMLSNTNYTIENPNIILNPYGNSPLSALIIFQTKDLTTATITIQGKDGAKDLTHTFIPAKTHILPVYGLYAGYDNKVKINASGITKEITIKTEKLPNDFAKVTDIENNDFKTEDFYFTTPEEIGYTAAYDASGEVRWYLIGDYKWDIQRLNNGHILLSSDKVLNENYSVGLIEMDLLGKIYYEYAIPGGYHHDVYELNNGNFLLASNSNKNTVEDVILEIDRATGNIVKEIDLYDILPGEKEGNWFGLNSINYDINTNSITISGYNSNMIVNLDYPTSEINWIIADNPSDEIKQYLLKENGEITYPNKPESITLLENNKLIYATSYNGKKHIITYEIDYSNQSVKEINNYQLNKDEKTNLDVIDNSLIITQNGLIKEINDEDIKISMNVNTPLYNTKKMSLYDGDIYTKVQGVRLGSLGETKTIKDYILLTAKNGNDIIKKYNITLYKDVFGLKISGSFEKTDDVQIILDNVLDKKTYNIISNGVSSTYISEDGINGKYYIYLRINGTIYKLYKYVNFN